MKYGIILLLSLACSFTATAQERQNPPTVEEMTEHKWIEISTKSHLTDDEKKAVYPVFVEYEKAVFDANKCIWDLLKKTKGGKESEENVNYAEINNKCINNDIKQANLLKKYHEKLVTLLAPKTLFNYYQAERSFKKKLMQNAGYGHKPTAKQ